MDHCMLHNDSVTIQDDKDVAVTLCSRPRRNRTETAGNCVFSG
jgi:hypothetical protein